MASQSLYRKWRSQTFSDLVGQEPIVETLKNALDTNQLRHAYIFTGPRGTGKTSTARLLAKTLNCTNRQNGEPCNICEQCREITAGNSFNVIEIDAASNRGIDSIRELREKVMIRPSEGKYKVYILDEAHMLTVEAFNALLKTLEEPPEYAIFVLATTDVHKMLPTVLSRCQRFDFKRITTREIVKHLLFIAGEERITIDRGAAELVARAAAGGMRDALSLLDQAIAYSGHDISLAKVQTMLGVADPRAIQKFVTHIANCDSAAGLYLVHELVEAGADLRQLNMQVAEYMRAMMLHSAGANIAEILDSTEDEIRDITQTAQFFSLEELTDCARVFAQNELMQKNQGTPQLGLELALLACIARHRNGQAAPAQLVKQSNTSSAPINPPLRAVYSQEPTRTITPPPVAPTPIMSAVQAPEPKHPPVVQSVNIMKQPVPIRKPDGLPDWDDLPMDDSDEYEEPVAPPTRPALSTVPQREVQPEQSVIVEQVSENAAPAITVEDIKEKWEEVKRRVKTRKDGSMIQAVLNGYTILAVEGTNTMPVIVLQASGKFHYDTLQKEERRISIEWALKIELEQECQVRLLPPGQAIIPLPPPPLQNTNGRVANSGVATQSQRPPYRELTGTAPVPTSPRPTEQQRPPQAASTTVQLTPPKNTASPLARTRDVSENTTSEKPVAGNTQPQDALEDEVPRETMRDVLEKKAKNDLVVKEVIRTFKANIKEVEPKYQ